jgi:hypothetical protein
LLLPAAAAADYKSRIVQRGGVPPLIRMLSSSDLALKEMAAFALGRLAQNTHNQAGIVQVGVCGEGVGAVGAVGFSVALGRLAQNTHLYPVCLHNQAGIVQVCGDASWLWGCVGSRELQPCKTAGAVGMLSTGFLAGGRTIVQDCAGRLDTQHTRSFEMLFIILGANRAWQRADLAAIAAAAGVLFSRPFFLQSGGLPQLLDLLESKQINLQHNAAFALYGLSDNEDNIPCIVQAGGLQRLYDCSERLQVQASKVGWAGRGSSGTAGPVTVSAGAGASCRMA